MRKILLSQAAPQAAAFVARYHDRLAAADIAALGALGTLATRGVLGRRLALVRHGLWFASPLKNAGLLLLC